MSNGVLWDYRLIASAVAFMGFCSREAKGGRVEGLGRGSREGNVICKDEVVGSIYAIHVVRKRNFLINMSIVFVLTVKDEKNMLNFL